MPELGGDKPTPDVVLCQFRPAWAAQAYLRFASIPHHLDDWSHPTTTTTGLLPQLRHGSRLLPADHILDYLRDTFKDLDASLSPSTRAQVAAFSSLIQIKLGAALTASRWLDSEHLARVTRPQLLEAMPFPANRVWLWRQKEQVISDSKIFGISDLRSAAAVAMDVYGSLSQQLGENMWLLGTLQPTSADAMLFGHLTEAMTEPLVNQLRLHSNLIHYYNRVTRQYFESVPKGLCVTKSSARAGGGESIFEKQGKFRLAVTGERPPPLPTAANREDARRARKARAAAKAAAEKEATSDEELSLMARNRNWLIGAVVGVLAYFVVGNMPAIRFVDDYDEDEDYEYDDDEEVEVEGEDDAYLFDEEEEMLDELDE